MEFQRWGVLKSKIYRIYAHNSTCSKGEKSIILPMNYGSSKNTKIELGKLIFYVIKMSESFRKTFSVKNINLGHQLLLKTFFDKFNFKNDLFLKPCPIFDELSFIKFFKKLSFKYVDSWPKILLFRTHHL